jgi:hypothetical protein
MLDEVRIQAEIVVADEPGVEGLVAVSEAATLVFVPFRIHGGNFFHPFGGNVADIMPSLPITVLTLAAQDIDLTAEPETGAVAEAAAAQDRLARAVQRHERREREAESAEADAAKAAALVLEARQGGEEADEIRRLEALAAETKAKAETARRKADRAAAFHASVERKEEQHSSDS